MRTIIAAAEEPYKTYYWILAETGMRAGEIGALTHSLCIAGSGRHKDFARRLAWQDPDRKSKKGNRICEISKQLAEHLRKYILASNSNPLGLLFCTSNGTPWDADTLRKRRFHPLLKEAEHRTVRVSRISSWKTRRLMDQTTSTHRYAAKTV
jgi:integrase